MSMTRATIRLPSQQLDRVDDLVEQGIFPNRSEAIRAAIRNELDRQRERRDTDRQRLRHDGGGRRARDPARFSDYREDRT